MTNAEGEDYENVPWWRALIGVLVFGAVGVCMMWWAVSAGSAVHSETDAAGAARSLEHGLHYLFFAGMPLLGLALISLFRNVLKLQITEILDTCEKYVLIGGAAMLLIAPSLITVPVVERNLETRGYAECPWVGTLIGRSFTSRWALAPEDCPTASTR